MSNRDKAFEYEDKERQSFSIKLEELEDDENRN